MFFAMFVLVIPGAEIHGWEAGPEWTVSSAESLSVRSAKNSFAWNRGAATLGSTWRISAEMRILQSTREIASAKLALGRAAVYSR